MTDKQLKLIANYMKDCGWRQDATRLIWRTGNTSTSTKWNPINEWSKISFDSNSAWECVQEMEKKEDWDSFYHNAVLANREWKKQHNYIVDSVGQSKLFYWLMNPDNFFTHMANWLEERSK